MKKLRVGILGATGMVGQRFVQLLHNHPFFEISLLSASEKSRNRRYSSATRWVLEGDIPELVGSIKLEPTNGESITDNQLDVVFSAVPSKIAEEVEVEIAKAGIPVFSNAGAHRMKEDVPILIPELNANHLAIIKAQDYGTGFIVTNSNCSTSGLVFGLKPLMPYGIKEVTVTTMQAISGAGRTGVSSLDILGNVVPFIKNEEEKMESEPQKILGELTDGRIIPAPWRINATCTRVPVLDGHLESISVRLAEDISSEVAIEAFSTFSGEISDLDLPTSSRGPIDILFDEDRPQPARDLYSSDDPLGMTVKIGRIRKKGRNLSFILLVHNTMRGAAGASVLNAEYALKAGFLQGVSL